MLVPAKEVWSLRVALMILAAGPHFVEHEYAGGICGSVKIVGQAPCFGVSRLDQCMQFLFERRFLTGTGVQPHGKSYTRFSHRL